MAQFAAYVLASHPAPGGRGHRPPPCRSRRGHPRLPGGHRDRRRARRARAPRPSTSAPSPARWPSPTARRWASACSTSACGCAAARRCSPPSTTSTPPTRRWRLRADRDGVTVRRVRLYDDPAAATADEIVGRLMAAVTPADPGGRGDLGPLGHRRALPVRAIADALAEANAGRATDDRALLCVDGVHGLGVEDVTVADLGCDFLVAGTHKWLFGPRGTGIVWGRTDAWAAVDPGHPGVRAQQLRRVAQRPAPGADRRRAVHPRRLPQLRAPLGAGRGVPVPPRHRARPGGRPHRRAGHAAQGGPGRDPRGDARDADGRGPVGRHRLLRRRRAAPRSRGRPARRRGLRHLGHALRRASTCGSGPSIVTSPDEVDGLLEALRSG